LAEQTRQLRDLAGVGPAMLDDFRLLGIGGIERLAGCDPWKLYRDLCRRTAARHDPCVLDVFRCAIEQARNPRLPAAKRKWWYWTAHRTEAERAALAAGRNNNSRKKKRSAA
jgi:hypothetical protein